MPITRRWANDEQTIMVFEFNGTVQNAELIPVYQEALDVIRELDHPVHVIIDHTAEVLSDESFVELLPQIGEALNYPPNMGLVIQVATKGSVRARTQLYSVMYHKVHHVDMMEDAYALIKVYDERRKAGDPSKEQIQNDSL